MSVASVSAGGRDIGYRDWGYGSPLIVLHGFTGSAAAMSVITVPLSKGHRVIAIDLIGHGESSKAVSEANYTIDAAVADIDRVIDDLSLAPAHLLGYSMGGRVALSYAVARPRRLSSLVLVGASAGIADPGERAARRSSDDHLADRLEAEGIEWFVDYWMAQEILRPRSGRAAAAEAMGRRQRLDNDPIALAGVLRGLGTGAMPPLHHALAGVDLPVAVVAGEADGKYRRIASELVLTMPDARLMVIPGAGHSVHTDNPDELAAALLPFFAEVDQLARR